MTFRTKLGKPTWARQLLGVERPIRVSRMARGYGVSRVAPARNQAQRRTPMVQSRLLLLGAAALAVVSQAPSAQACGGFFCGRTPVDQTAERILFEIGDESVTMTTQISYNGAAEDFAWVLPLLEVPDPDSLAVFSQRALTGLDAASGPTFYSPCAQVPEAAAGGGGDADG